MMSEVGQQGGIIKRKFMLREKVADGLYYYCVTDIKRGKGNENKSKHISKCSKASNHKGKVKPGSGLKTSAEHVLLSKSRHKCSSA